MNTIDLTTTDLTVLTAVELRKTAAAAGIKGASKGRKNDLALALAAIKTQQLDEAAAVAAIQAAAAEPVKTTTVRKGSCNVCEKRSAVRGTNGQCQPCFDEGGWENTHSDFGHAEFDLAKLTEEQAAEVHGCWICYPELNLAQRDAATRGSKSGMEIKAKGDKVQVFKAAAEAAGFTVTVQVETYEGGNTRTYATAVFGGIKGEHIVLAWEGSRFDYPNSQASKDGKVRKVRNLSEALRLLER